MSALRRAFTLVEMLVVLALFAVIASVVVVGIDSMISEGQKKSPRDVLREAVDAAWYAAAGGQGDFFLRYDEEAGVLAVYDNAGAVVKQFPFADERVGEVRFVRVPDTGGGSLRTSSTEPFRFLRFSEWSGVTPAIIEMDIDGAIYRYQIEPFSGATEAVR